MVISLPKVKWFLALLLDIGQAFENISSDLLLDSCKFGNILGLLGIKTDK